MTTEQTTARERRRDLKNRLFEAALVHASFDGWSERTLKNAAIDVGIEADAARRLFPQGGRSMLGFLDEWLTRKLEDRLAQEPAYLGTQKERLTQLIMWWLEPLAPHREAARRALGVRWLPLTALSEARSSLSTARKLLEMSRLESQPNRNLLSLASPIALAPVLGAVTLYWLRDNSAGFADTKRFIRRRLDGMDRLARLASSLPWSRGMSEPSLFRR